MTTNFISEDGVEWYKNYKHYSSHMYVTQWTIVDYKVLDRINLDLKEGRFEKNSLKKEHEGLVVMVEEVPGSIKGTDLTKFVFDNEQFGSFNMSYFPDHQKILNEQFGSFNMSYFPEHQKILGINSIQSELDIYSKEHNPRYYLFNQLAPLIVDVESFSKVILYNGYNNSNSEVKDDPSYDDPSNGISSRDDLLSMPSYHGGVDFKIVDRDLVNNLSFYAYGGPTYNEKFIKPFNWETVND
eukprot:CAMPEP_0170539648 /NCGR_PEP_ID=MMETSP0209-20121228/104079_1 /TAXON_ID=665100 ORGANISM="Litonotus pictus, Strain P1" /NCGR_SAMPLE_ID=MMETSP0209 /ASSEMBLY_ACC=CAM_ASM_000301 /LENGTH=240 /DNA_ID=CAMNT_0010841663 /DNA_START=337 /DNA_END=1056 /DNA_ORIENTATION=-